MTPHTTRPMVDGYGRAISYLRISLTDRCNLRCRYCLPLHAEFMPKSALLSFEELGTLTRAFMARGTRRIRLTGGEPLVRRGVMDFIESFTPFLADGTLDEVTMTTNGALLGRYAQRLVDAGVKRINISLDTLDGERFRTITRSNQFPMVLDGIETALAAGLKLKINTVAMAGINDDEFPRLVRYAHERGMDITFIEIMPLGDVDLDRAEHFMSVEDIRAALGRHFTLERTDYRSAGPANYVRSAETGGRIGFINPMSHSFCATCNKVRLSAAGVLFTCLGHEHQYDLGTVLRSGGASALDRMIDDAIRHKPYDHGFVARMMAEPALSRTMSALGG